jgi:hypothetical protein
MSAVSFFEKRASSSARIFLAILATDIALFGFRGRIGAAIGADTFGKLKIPDGF